MQAKKSTKLIVAFDITWNWIDLLFNIVGLELGNKISKKKLSISCGKIDKML